ncbi:MAG TPA: response regulator, partial [Candidatus Polarisedimenticolia bacterium]|nr:response regulator [Candidatus Polarisedimenticolia bacterium]
ILVVDDEASILDIVGQALRLDGHTVETALGGEAALLKLETDGYDLIISDLKMPGMSGQELYARVSSQNPRLASRFVFSTGDTLNPATRSFLDQTGSNSIQKPFEIQSMRDLVGSLLNDVCSDSNP